MMDLAAVQTRGESPQNLLLWADALAADALAPNAALRVAVTLAATSTPDLGPTWAVETPAAIGSWCGLETAVVRWSLGWLVEFGYLTDDGRLALPWRPANAD